MQCVRPFWDGNEQKQALPLFMRCPYNSLMIRTQTPVFSLTCDLKIYSLVYNTEVICYIYHETISMTSRTGSQGSYSVSWLYIAETTSISNESRFDVYCYVFSLLPRIVSIVMLRINCGFNTSKQQCETAVMASMHFIVTSVQRRYHI